MSDRIDHADPERRCPSTRLSGAQCSLPVGHPGSHMQIDDNGATGWSDR